MAVWAQANGLDCRACNKQLRDFRGCTEDAANEYEIEGNVLRRCPLRTVDGRSAAMLEMFFAYKQGFLPNAGGWLDQPLMFTQSMAIIENYAEKLKEEKKHGAE